MERTWCQPSPLTSPERVRAMRLAGKLTPRKQAEYLAMLNRVGEVLGRYPSPRSEGERGMVKICRWILDQWKEKDLETLGSGP